MIGSEHIAEADLLGLLESESDSSKSRKLSLHLQDCEQCRARLEALSAGTNFWQAAPEHLKNSDSSYGNSNSSKTELFIDKRSEVDSSEDSYLGYSISLNELLESPKHPEMMGRLGKYDIEREIGRGGMGIVLKAHDSELNRPLAIKVLAPHLASHGTARKRFAQEARSAAGVIHPNVIDVYGVNNEGKNPYIVMPYISGHSLQKMVDSSGPLSEIEITRISLQIAAGLTAAHSQGLVHRDIKPANILVEESVNRVLITDFGLARAEDDASLTRTGWLTGTPNYMSPEQARGQRLDHRSDLFSLGSLMYFLATGRLPFRADSPLGVLNRIQNDTPNTVRSINNQISRTLQDVIEVLHEKDTEKRFASAGVLHDILEKHLAHLHQPEVFRPPVVKQPMASPVSWKMLAFGAIAGLVIAGAGFSAFSGNGIIPVSSGSSQSSFSPVASAGLVEQDENQDKGQDSGSKESTDIDIRSMVKQIEKEKADQKTGKKIYKDGYQLYSDKKYEQAIKVFEKSRKYKNVEPESVYNIACCYALMGKKDPAFQYLEQAINVGFDNYGHYKSDGDLDSLKSDPRFEVILKRLANRGEVQRLVSKTSFLNSRGDYVQAENLCRKILQQDSGNTKAILNLGYALHLQGKLEEAEKCHLKSVNTEHAALALYNLCCIRSLQNRPDAAIAFLKKSFKAGLATKLSMEHLQEDKDLENIRNHVEFRKTMKRLRILKSWRSIFMVTRGSEVFENIQDFKGYYWGNPVSGRFKLDSIDRLAELTLLRHQGEKDFNWTFKKVYEEAKFDRPLDQKTQKLTLQSDFGNVVLSGEIVNGQGEGTFIFVPSKSYEQKLKKQGVENVSDGLLFRFFASRMIERNEIENLKTLQKLGLDPSVAMPLMAEGVSADLVKGYAKNGLSVSKHLHFALWKVRASLLMAYKQMGYDLDKMRKFILWRVNPSLIKSYQDAGLSLEDNANFLQKRVSADLLTRYQQAGFDLKKYHGFIQDRIAPSLLKDYQDAAFNVFENNQLLKARAPSSLLSEYKKLGLDTSKYSKFIARHIPGSLVKDYEKNQLDLEQHFQFLQRQVPSEFVLEYQNEKLNLHQYERYLANRIPAKSLKRYLESELNPEQYIGFLRSGVSAKALKKYLDAGLNPNRFRQFVNAGVSPGLIKRYQAKGLKLNRYRRQILQGKEPDKVSNRVKQ